MKNKINNLFDQHKKLSNKGNRIIFVNNIEKNPMIFIFYIVKKLINIH